MAIKIVDAGGLAKVLHTQGTHPLPSHRAKPAQGARVSVDHGDQVGIARQRREQILHVTLAIEHSLAACSVNGVPSLCKAIGGGHGQQSGTGKIFLQLCMGGDGFTGDGAVYAMASFVPGEGVSSQ